MAWHTAEIDWVAKAAGRCKQVFDRHRVSIRRGALLAALVGFLAGTVWAFFSVAGSSIRVEIIPILVLLALGVPATIALNAAEFALMSRVGGQPQSWRAALVVTVFASAANMLPLPGAAFTRLAGMRARGIALRHGSTLILLFAGIWAGIALCLSGAALVGHVQALGLGFIGAGICVLAAAVYGLRFHKAGPGMIGAAVAIRLSLLGIEVLRMVLAFGALGVLLSPLDAATFSVSSFVGAAVSIVPAGLGVREGVVALMAPIIGVAPAIGFLSSAINRLVDMAVLAALALLLLLRTKRDTDGEGRAAPKG